MTTLPEVPWLPGTYKFSANSANFLTQKSEIIAVAMDFSCLIEQRTLPVSHFIC